MRHRSDGRLLAVALWDASVRLYDCSRLKPLATLRYQREAVDTIAFIGGLGNNDEEVSPWKGHFATGSKDGSIAVWDIYANTAQ